MACWLKNYWNCAKIRIRKRTYFFTGYSIFSLFINDFSEYYICKNAFILNYAKQAEGINLFRAVMIFNTFIHTDSLTS